ncbi:hypothetical protein DSC45_04540 [Streptomyces sp. YIM 130001]|uniref:hypothetical protein n=1 Tax=Streptomyces sp. YIM 130001 TaxID=2259644 RepID=UPI000EE28178|nr:hypothetical protein [Streptomyces sp. YIM 130001]RII20474.1 hypothetical protein DSC45_04540 [Streptomyces sp. YIM 130001]
MSKPDFMSPEHVRQMNRLLGASADVAAACAALDRDYVLTYELSDGPHGTEHWVMRFDRRLGVSFSLESPPASDVTYVGDWSAVVRAAGAAREGVALDPAIRVRGDSSVLAHVADAFTAAQTVATVPVEFPCSSGDPAQ